MSTNWQGVSRLSNPDLLAGDAFSAKFTVVPIGVIAGFQFREVVERQGSEAGSLRRGLVDHHRDCRDGRAFALQQRPQLL